MGNHVQGKNITVYMKVSGTYYPIFCGKSMTWTRSQELIETTNTESGSDTDYEAGFSSATLDVTGITILDNTDLRISQNYLEQQSIRRVKQDFKITQTADNGDIHVRTFQGLVRQSSFDKSIPGYSNSYVTIQVCGAVTMDTVEPPASGNEVIYSDWWVFTAGATSISGTSSVHAYNLIGVTVLEVDREGMEHDIITSGTPGNRQCKHDNTAGEIAFNSSVPSLGETVFVLFKRVL